MKQQKLTSDDLVTAIYNDLGKSVDYANTSLREVRKHALDRFFDRPRGDEIAGRSKVRSTLIRDTVFALMATITPSFKTDHLIDFPPVGPDDVDASNAEANACNALFSEDNNGLLNLTNSIQNCLLQRNGILKVWVENKTTVSTRRFIKNPGDTAAMIQTANGGDDWEIEAEDEQEVTFRITTETQELRVDSVEPAYFYTDPNQADQDMQAASFMAERTFYTRSELLEMDIAESIVKELPANQDESITDGVGASNSDITAKFIDGQSDIGQASTWGADRIECYWVHGSYDTDGDGITEKWRFLVSNRELLLEDPVDYFPYATFCGWTVANRWSGLSVYDLLRHTEDQQTNDERQFADNLNIANNQRPIYDPGKVEQGDILNSAPGRGIRRKEGATIDFVPVMDIASNSLAHMQHLDDKAGQQAGAALDLMSGDIQGMKDISGISAEMQLGPKEMMASWVSQNIADGVRRLFLLMHETLRNEWNGPIMYRKSGDWQQTMPAEWRPRTRCNVMPGLSPGERRRRVMHLTQIRQDQMQLIASGNANIIVGLKGFYNATRDWLTAMEINDAEEYYTDPASQESQQAQQQQMQQGQQEQQMQMQQMQMQMQVMQMQVQLEQQKVQIDAMKVENDKADDLADNEFDRLKLAAEMEMKEVDLVTLPPPVSHANGRTAAISKA
ncbi:MAG: hypothetical protein GY764_08115, partial [Halieaceae bacterium]|nr:hypothetical protein [Halieaceae bacterium]